MHVSHLEPQNAIDYEVGAGRGGYFYLIEGALELNGERMTTGDAAKIVGSGDLGLRALETSELILVDTPL